MGIRWKQAESLPWTALIKGSGVKVQGCRGTAVSINLLSLYRNIYHLSPIFLCVCLCLINIQDRLHFTCSLCKMLNWLFSITVPTACLKLNISVIEQKLLADQVCLDQFAKPSTLIILKASRMNKSARQAAHWLPCRKFSPALLLLAAQTQGWLSEPAAGARTHPTKLKQHLPTADEADTSTNRFLTLTAFGSWSWSLLRQELSCLPPPAPPLPTSPSCLASGIPHSVPSSLFFLVTPFAQDLYF